MNLAIIPARGGSKRIPRKNILPFRGRPIISYVIEAAFQSGCFDDVIVSTDDAEIAEVAQSFGASVPFLRSSDASNDHATTGEVIREVLETLKGQGRVFDVACCLYPTSALITPARIREASEMIQNSPQCEGIITLVRNPQPALRALVINDQFVDFMIKEQEATRSQDMPETYFDAGQMYWLKTEPFLKGTSRTMAFLKRYPLVLSEFESQDINTFEDWKLAEWKSVFLETFPEVLEIEK